MLSLHTEKTQHQGQKAINEKSNNIVDSPERKRGYIKRAEIKTFFFLKAE
jgi:hypothetical protein